jgi:hypothetical protein
MQLSTPLGQDEKVHHKYEFSYSLLLFSLKSHFWLTNKRLIVNHPNVFLFLPVGKNTVTYPLRNIGGIQAKTDFKFKSLFLGVLFVVIGLSALKSFGLLLLLLGVAAIVGAFQTVIVVGSAGGAFVRYSHLPWEAENAQQMVNELNQLIADI